MENLGKSSGMKRLGLVLVACFVAAPLAAVPVMGQIAFRPLTIGHSLKVAKAFGADDEDCIYVTRRVPRPNGLVHVEKTLVCDD